jgi:hypothetical protein
MRRLNERGQILVLVTLGFVLLGIFTGLAIDMGRGYLENARLQRVVDAASIAAANVLRGQVANQGAATTAAEDAARMNGYTCCSPTADLNVDFVARSVQGGPPMQFVQITGRSVVPTTFSRLLNLVASGGFDNLNVGAFAEAGPERPVDLMLVLDRSGSMNTPDGTGQRKITALKAAVNAFLSNSFSPDDRIGVVSFGSRGCGIGGNDSNATNCIPDVSLAPFSSSLTSAVNGLCPNSPNPCIGGTNTAEALLTGTAPMAAAFGDLARATSRKAVLLVTDGQPTFMRRNSISECNTNPLTGAALPTTPGPVVPWAINSGCTFGVPSWTSDNVYGTTAQRPGIFRNAFTAPSDATCSSKVPRFLPGTAPCNQNYTSATLYRDTIAAARIAARNQANTLRTLGGNNVVIFVIAIGLADLSSPQGSLDANAKCLLARIANDPVAISNCSSVFTTQVDGDPHSDLIQNWPCGAGPCIDNAQQRGQVFTIDQNGNVQAQLQDVFNTVAALLKLRLTI